MNPEDILPVFRAVLGLPEAATDDCFFELGGDSLMAETLIGEVSAMSGVDLPVSVLLEASSPVALAALIDRRRAARQSTLLTSVSDAGGEAIVLVHPVSGSPLFANRIGPALRSRFSIYALRGLGTAPGEDEPRDADDLIEAYDEGIRSALRTEPAMIGGLCVGGLIALDLARRQWERTGRAPAVLLVDPLALDYGDPGAVGRFRRQFDVVARRAARNLIDKAGLGTTSLGRTIRRHVFEKSMYRAYAVYNKAPFPADILLISSSEWREKQITEAFRKWLQPTARLEIHTIAGQHTGFHMANREEIDRSILDFLDGLKIRNAA